MNPLSWLTVMDIIGFLAIRTLLSILWQSTILLAAVGILTHVLRRRKASIRYILWVIAILAIPLLPLFTWGVANVGTPQAELSLIPAYSFPHENVIQTLLKRNMQQYHDSRSDITGEKYDQIAPPAPPTPILEPDRISRSISITDYPWAFTFAGYIAVATLLLTWLIMSRIRIRNWIVHSGAVMNPYIIGIFNDAAKSIGLSREIIIVENEHIPAPLTCHTLKPVIILPSEFANDLSKTEIQAVAVHELTHIKRNDVFILSFLSMVRALFFFQPLMWLVIHRISYLAETACDDTVVDLTGQSTSYAEMLSRIAINLPEGVSSTELAVGIIFSKSAFLRRVESILSSRKDQIRELSRLALIGIAAMTALSLGIALAFPLVEAVKTHKVSGHVHYDGKPVSGAKVYLYQPSTLIRPTAQVLEVQKTKRDGSFISKVQSPDINIVTYTPRFALGWKSLLQEPDLENISIQLDRQATISGTVQDRDGQPIKGAEVIVRSVGITGIRGYLPELPELITKTDIQGKFTVTNLPEGVSVKLQILASGYAREFLPGIQTGSENVLFTLVPSGSIEGKVTYSTNGKPARNVSVDVHPLGEVPFGIQSTVTKRDGTYSFTHMHEGMYLLKVFLGDELKGWITAPIQNVEVNEGKTTEGVDIKLFKGGIVTGRVTERNTSEPIAGVRITVKLSASHLWIPLKDVKTDKNGFYQLRVPPGSVTIRAYSPQEFEADFSQSKGINIEDKETVSGVDFQFARGIEVTGRVLSPNGEPISGVTITDVRGRPDRAWRGSTLSDKNGTFTLYGVIEEKILSISAEHKVLNLRGNSEMEAKSDTEIVINLEKYETINIEGRIIDEEGNPIAGVTVLLGNPEGNSGSFSVKPTSVTNNFGKFKIPDLITGINYFIIAQMEGYAKNHISLPQITPSMLSLEDVVMRKTDCWVAGKVTDSEGNPVVGAEIMIYCNLTDHKKIETDEEGHYRQENIVHMNIKYMSIKHKDLGYYKFRNVETNKTNDFTLIKPNYTLSGRIIDADNNPIEGAFISIRPQTHESGFVNVDSRTGHQGEFRIMVSDKVVTFKVSHKERGEKTFENFKTDQDDVTFVIN